MIWQIIFLVGVILAEIALAGFCMLVSGAVLSHLQLASFWKSLLGISLTAVFIFIIGAPTIYLQAKYKACQERKKPKL